MSWSANPFIDAKHNFFPVLVTDLIDEDMPRVDTQETQQNIILLKHYFTLGLLFF